MIKNILKSKFILDENLFESYLDNNNEQLYREIASQVRKEFIDRCGPDLTSQCIDASDRIVELLKEEGISARTVDKYIFYDFDHDFIQPYEYHSWVETEDGYYIDVTADQFNHIMDYQYPEIIVSTELPPNYSYSRDYLEENLTEAKKKRKNKKVSQVNPGEAIFKSVKDMQKWVKKRQKGMSPWGSFNTNAGNVEVCSQFFNQMMSGGADGSSGLGISNGGLSSPAASGNASGGMGESFNTKESSSETISANVKNIILQNQDLINNDLKEFINYSVITLNANEIIELFNILLDAGVGVDIDMVANVK